MYNILIGCYGHETNTSTPDVTDLKRFGGRDGIIDSDGTHLYNRGFSEVLKKRSDVNIIPSVAAWACPWGRVDADTNEYITGKILESIRNADRLDGILLSLHGAMVTTASEDGEGDLLEKIRNEIGPDVPIGVILDLHANITEKMIRNASWIINYDTYPHIDAFERAAECAELMLDTLDGKVKPVMSCIKLPLLTEFLPTTQAPAKIILDAMLEEEKNPAILAASVSYGFFCADIAESGAAVITISNNDSQIAESAARRIAAKMWDLRYELKRHFITVDEALDDISAHPESYPAILADCCDNPGGGATGDATHILRRLVERDVKHSVAAFIYDPESVAKAEKTGVGNIAEFDIGGKIFPQITGGPVHGTAYVKAIVDGHFDRGLEPDLNIMGDGNFNSAIQWPPVTSQHGKIAVLDMNGVIALVTTVQAQTWNDYGIRSCGIDPCRKAVIAVKSTVHFRHCFEKYAAKIYEIHTPGLSEQLIKAENIIKSRRPVFPLDDETKFDPFECEVLQ